jgi:glycosyltransferase involved in cell wall biosynthesis
MPHLRVALVSQSFGLRGSFDRQCVLLATSLGKLGVEVHVYCDPESRTLDAPEVTFHDVSAVLTDAEGRFKTPVNILSFAAKATRSLQRDRADYDLVHVAGCTAWEHDVVTAHDVTKAELWRWPDQGGRKYRAAHLRTFLAPVLQPRVALLRWIERRQLRSGAFLRVIARTEQVRDDLVNVQGVSPERIDVIPPAITVWPSASARADGLRTSLGVATDSSIVLFVGHDFERKGLVEAIEAFAGLGQSAQLVVAGSGNSGQFKRTAERLGVGHRVHFLGGTTRPELVYGEADVLLHPARWEVWGTPIVEAMAFGLPVVTTTATGSAREVQSAAAGVVISDASPRLLREALSALLDDPDRRREMGERGRVAAAQFLPEAHAERTLETYTKALRHRADRDGGRQPVSRALSRG